MQKLAASAKLKCEQDIVETLQRQFIGQSRGNISFDINNQSESQLSFFVHPVCEIGWKHGFDRRGDLYALVEACVRLGPKNFISPPVLEHPRLSAHEKVQVMLDLHKEGLAPQQQVLNPT